MSRRPTSSSSPRSRWWWPIATLLMITLPWSTSAWGITVDGVVGPDEWTQAKVIILDPNEPEIPDDYDVSSIMLDDGHLQLYVSISVYGDHPALAAAGSERPYLNFYFNLYAAGGPVHRFGLTYNDGYGFDPDEMHLVQYGNGQCKDLGQPTFAIDSAVEVAIPWSMLPEKLTGSGPIAVQGLFFLYNVAPGDLDNDGSVGLNDLNILLSHWGSSVPLGALQADPDRDGFVGQGDLSILLNHWGYHSAGGCTYDMFDEETIIARNELLTEHLPEPLTMLTIGMGIAGLAGYVRKRRMA